MDEDYEAALAHEGDSAYTEDQWIAWEEALALAPDLAAKKELVHGAFGATTPDFAFRAALCTLLEVQELLDERTSDSNAKANALMEKEKEALVKSERELCDKGYWRKAKRVTHRRAVLELEIATRLGKPVAKIKELARAVATAMGLTLSDPAPTNVEVEVQESTSIKTAIQDDEIATEKRVLDSMRQLHYYSDEYTFKSSVRSDLNNMEPYARELFFAYVVGEKAVWAKSFTSSAKDLLSGVFKMKSVVITPTTSLSLSSEQCWWIFELFLDEFAFECADVEGYLDVIVADLKRSTGTSKQFDSRKAHSRLSRPQLQVFLEQEPKLFRDDAIFAMRYIYFMHAEHQTNLESELEFRDDFKRVVKTAALEGYLSALSVFSPCVNTIRAWILHEQLREMQYHAPGELKPKFIQYIALPRFGADFVNPNYIRKAKADELVSFEQPSYSYRHSNQVQPSTELLVDVVSSAFGDYQVNASEDLRLIKSILYSMWATGQMTDEDETSIRSYLSAEFVDAHKAECMIFSGRGDVSDWKSKLPYKGGELAQWSSGTEIAFCESNPSYFSPEDEMEFFVNVRNVKTLTVQVYEVRTIDYYTRMRSEVQGDICLDGLLPNEEQQIDLSHLLPWQKACVPVKVSPTATGRRGVFVVEVFEKDTTCRAILRKGYLRHVQCVTSRGIEISVLDEHGVILTDATLMVMNLKGGGSKAQAPRTYAPVDDSGTIIVPFRQAGESAADKFGIIFRHGDFGYLTRAFDYVEAVFSLEAQIYIDNEQLRPGEDANLLVRPVLSVGSVASHIVSVEMLTDIKVTSTFSSVNRESSAAAAQKTVQTFSSIRELIEGRCSLAIPLDADGVSVNVHGRVRMDSTTELVDLHKLPSVSASKSFVVQRVTQFQDTFTPHFIRREVQPPFNSRVPQYEHLILVLGHNGERMRGRAMTVTLQHLHFKNSIPYSLTSDQNGEIKLGKLQFVEEVQATFSGNYSGGNSWKWELPNLHTYAPQMVNCSASEEIRIPLPVAFSNCVEDWIAAGLIALYRVADLTDASDEPALEQMGNDVALMCVKSTSDQVVAVTFQVDRVGNYILVVRPLDTRFPITVCKLKRPLSSIGTGGLLMQRKKTLFATSTRPLMIANYSIKSSSTEQKSTLLIQLDQANPTSTQVWVILKQSLDQTDSKLSSVVKAEGLSHRGGNHFMKDLAFEHTVFENEYLKKRKISDEYTYILQRRAFIKANPSSLMLLGTSSLPRPTLIQTPHIVDETDMEELVMRAGEKVSGFKSNQERASSARVARLAGGQYMRAGLPSMPATSSISFLARSSSVVCTSAVNADGVVRVCLSDIPLFSEANSGSFELVILAFDINNGQATSLESQITKALNDDEERNKRDVRLASDEALNNDTPSMQLQCHEVLTASQSRVLPRSFSSKYALYETLQSAMDLWATLCSDSSIPELANKLKSWSSMKPKAKVAFYLKNACDDLNFFIYRKDREFFDEQVKPYISAKLSPSLIDLFVLGDVATIKQRYGHPGQLQKLSIIEKLLVAERSGSMEMTLAICQHVVDTIDGACAVNESVGHQLSRVFDTVLSQGAVKPDPSIDLVVAEEVAVVESCYEAFSAPPPPPAPGGFGGGFSYRTAAGSAPITRSSAAFGASSDMMRRSAAPMMAMAMPSASSTSFHDLAASKAKKKVSRALSESESDDSEDYQEDEDDDFGVESLNSDDDGDAGEEEGGPDDDEDKQARKLEATKRRSKPYVLAGKVRRIQEKRYFRDQKPHLDGRNLFWRDYAKHLMKQTSDETRKPFLSSHFPEALRSFTEGILALSVLDLAMEMSTPTSVRLLAGGHRVQLDAVADVVLYHQGIGAGEMTTEPNSVLILKQRLVSHADLASASSRDFVDIRPAREFLVNLIYSCVVSVSNIGSTRLKNVNLLRQIPRGSIPVASEGFYTKNEVIEIAPHDTQMYTCNFYFPETGTFTQYPAHASLDGEVIAWATVDEQYTKPISVVLKATAVDLTSWTDVAARGTLQDVVTFIGQQPSVASLDLNALAWRCQEKSFYDGLVGYLRGRWVFVDSIWKYAFLHNDTVGIQEVTSSKDDFIHALGAGVHTSIVQLSEIYHQERFDTSFSFDHTEFGPLLARRVHRVAGKVESSTASFFGSTNEVSANSDGPPRVLHKKAREYYRTLCHVLSLQPTLTANQLLVVSYYLILFQRISDALKVFERVKALESSAMTDTNECSIAADYIDSYLDLFRPCPAEQGLPRFPVTRRNVVKYAKLTNERWRVRFSRLHEVLDEYDELQAAAKRSTRTVSASASDRAPKQTSQRVPDDQEVRLKAEVNGDEIHFTSQHLGACEISCYRIDVELMFSTEPFDSFSASAASKSSLLLIQPWKRMRVELADEGAETTAGASSLVTKIFRLPSELAASPMLLRIREIESTRTVQSVAAPIDLTRSYFNSELQVVVTKQAGTVQILHNDLPVPSCYVKVYAKASGPGASTRGSKTQFYKDGYTDVLGKFDYAAINGDLLTRVEKFSLLVSHPNLGTTVEQALPPVLAVTSSEFTDREAQESLWF